MAKSYSIIDINGRQKSFNTVGALFTELSDSGNNWCEGEGSSIKKGDDVLFHTTDYAEFVSANKKAPSIKGIMALIADRTAAVSLADSIEGEWVEAESVNDQKTVIKNYSTTGFLINHKNLSKRVLARAELDVYGDDDVHVYAVSSRNLEKIRNIGSVTITRKKLSELPDDPYNDTVFAEAVFGLLGATIN